MTAIPATGPNIVGRHQKDLRVARLESAIKHVAHLLPAQGPITSFVHHNTLHAFEHLHFDEAVRTGAKIYGCEPYLPEQEFRKELARGRIRVADLEAVLREDLGASAGEPVLHFCSRFELRRTMLEHPLLSGSAAELRWFVSETDALRKFSEHVSQDVRAKTLQETRHWAMRDLVVNKPEPASLKHEHPERLPLAGLFQRFDRASMEQWNDDTWQAFTLQASWRICRAGVHRVGPASNRRAASIRHRDLLLEAIGEDSDMLVHELLIRICGAYVDQGIARWAIPGREQGFFHAFCTLYLQGAGPPDRWIRGLREELTNIANAHVTSLDSILDSLVLLGVPEEEWESFLTSTLLALRGWAGMIQQLALREDRVVQPVAPDSLVDYLAIRLIFERFALAHLAAANLPEYGSQLRTLRGALRRRIAAHGATVGERAFPVFQVAQLLGWLPRDLYHLSQSQWKLLVREVEEFDHLERRRIYQEAYERRYRNETLDAIAVHAGIATKRPGRPKFQAVFCLDEREESFRRHLEEVAPDVETYAAAGFFGVAMYYRGAAQAHYAPLCPVVIQPRHWVVEDVAYTQEQQHQRRVRARRAVGTAMHRVHVATRSFMGGAITAFFGTIASIPLVMRVVFPRLTSQLRRTLGRMLVPPQYTQLRLERMAATTPSNDISGIGYTLSEMTDIVEHLLRDIGLANGFSRLVFIVGHGSSSLNNPLEPAYDCGACGGARGGPNARAFAQMANHAGVRRMLEQRQIFIPSDTLFIGAFHNTCSDAFTLFDVDHSSFSHKEDLAEAEAALQVTRERNAHERCRRFDSAPLSISPEEALQHVEERSEDLAQTRPELGHATNAVCYVGRRFRCRGLYMDRRTFLTSYDPTQDDDEGTILARILAAAVPVCAGISLEYYFSRVDTPGWGCGSKLPHNVASRLGVMDGAASDLRPGLPWQMVELHEPVRLLFVIESTPETMLGIMERNDAIGQLCRNAWVQMATLDPHSNEIQLFDGSKFNRYQPECDHLPRTNSSASWYRGWRDHLGYAVVSGATDEGQF